MFDMNSITGSMHDPEAAEYRGTMMTTVIIVFLVMTWVTVLARTWVRAVMIRSFGWDDAVTLLAAVTYSLYAGFSLPLVPWAFGNSNVSIASLTFFSKVAAYLLASFALYAATMVIFKISLGIFYLRILVSRWQRVTLYITVAVSTIYGIFFFFMILFQCGMPADYLLNAVTDSCVGGSGFYMIVAMVAGVVNTVSDFILALLPIALVYKAPMTLLAKSSACMLLLLGCAGSAVSIARLFYIGDLIRFENLFENGTNLLILSAMEAGLCIIAASLATLRPLFAACLPSGRRSKSTDSQTQPMVTINEIIDDDLEAGPRIRSKRSMILGLNDKPLPPKPLYRISATPKTHELDTFEPATDAGVTRKASIEKGRVQWRNPRFEIPPEPSPQQPGWKISRARADSTPSAPPPIASYDKALLRGSHIRKPSLEGLEEVEEPSSPAMKRVGVGAWRK